MNGDVYKRRVGGSCYSVIKRKCDKISKMLQATIEYRELNKFFQSLDINLDE